MRGIRSFMIGMVASLSLSKTLWASGSLSSLSPEMANLMNTLISVIGGVASTITIAYLQHRWRIKEDDRRWRRDHPEHHNKGEP